MSIDNEELKDKDPAELFAKALGLNISHDWLLVGYYDFKEWMEQTPNVTELEILNVLANLREDLLSTVNFLNKGKEENE